MDDGRLMTTKEVARLLRITPQHLRWMKNQEAHGATVSAPDGFKSGRQWLFPERAVIRHLQYLRDTERLSE